MGQWGPLYGKSVKRTHLQAPGLNLHQMSNNNSAWNEVDVIRQLNTKQNLVDFHGSWQQGESVFIKQDLYTVDLATLLNVKGYQFDKRHLVFPRDDQGHVGLIEFGFCCYLYREILNMLAQLHNAKPSINYGNLKLDNILIKYVNRCIKFQFADFGYATRIQSAPGQVYDLITLMTILVKAMCAYGILLGI
ncbi:unnamed protein product [Oppiella nova]|uniref:Protein kinase domain-containing protein n=1 Tax=Oppiella nova TaxID=334625 RepID=A0A7R9MFK2_9ACAR|nr:unnamed protein product [Oppiella nova]CAG2176484.1 unnamed protein product [Oppiella nova]